MADQAGVHSIEALERFRSTLILYQEKAAASLHEIIHEVARVRSWLQQERLPFWRAEIRRLERSLEDAGQRLFSAQISAFRDTQGAEQREVRRLRELKRAAEDKLRAAETWAREYDVAVAPLLKAPERLRGSVEDLSQAIHALSGMIKSLESYAERFRPGMPPLPSAPSPSGEEGAPNPAPPSP